MQVVLFVGDDWAEDHHDVEVQDATGRRLGKARLSEGMAGIARLPALIGEFTDPDDEAGAGQVLVGIETDRGPWVAALVAAGYRMFAVNPMQVARYRERHCTSGAKSDAADAHTLADMVRTDAHQLRPVAGDTALAEGIKVVARAHQSMIWDRTRHVPRLRSTPREFFPARWRYSRTWLRPMRSNCSPRHQTRPRRPRCRAAASLAHSSGLAAVTWRARPSTSRRCYAPRRWASPRSWPAPTRSPSGPWSR